MSQDYYAEDPYEAQDPTIREIVEIKESTIETVDMAMYNWINENLNLHATTNEGWKKIPVRWVAPERSIQSKERLLREFRDISGALILPIMTLQRTSMEKDLGWKGEVTAAVGTVPIARTIQQGKTGNFVNADNKRNRNQLNFKTKKSDNRVVYRTVNVPIPIYITTMYKISVWTEFQEQMNELVTPFMTVPGGINEIILENDGHRYEAFIQPNFNQDDNIANMDDEERKYITEIEVKVLAYLLGYDKNKSGPKVIIRESAVDVKQPRERVMAGDSMSELTEAGKYRP